MRGYWNQSSVAAVSSPHSVLSIACHVHVCYVNGQIFLSEHKRIRIYVHTVAYNEGV